MKYTAIALLVGAVVGGLIMVIFEGDALWAVTVGSVAAAMGVATDMVIAKRSTRPSQVHTA